jgi:hypothetical protein
MDKNVFVDPANEIRTPIIDGIVLISSFTISQEQVDELSPVILQEVDKKQTLIQSKVRELAGIAELIVIYGEWNKDTPETITEKLNLLFKEAEDLLTWTVKEKWSDTDSHGNSYSAVRQVGVTASNPRVAYTFHSYK